MGNGPSQPQHRPDHSRGHVAVAAAWPMSRTPGIRSVADAGVPFKIKCPHYVNALRTHLPHATHVLNAFHLIKLAFIALDEVRRRVRKPPSVNAATRATLSARSAGCNQQNAAQGCRGPRRRRALRLHRPIQPGDAGFRANAR
jgi:hypothetical protein